MEYKECFEIMGKDRNSYSKTDLGSNIHADERRPYDERAAKAGIQCPDRVENYFIIHGYVSNDRTDYNTLIPVLEKHQKAFEDTLEAVTADSGLLQ